MKKIILKFKILITNISRIIMSFLFVNLSFSFDNKAFGVNVVDPIKVTPDITCYEAGPTPERRIKIVYCIIILAPVVIAIASIIYKIKKKKKKKSGEKKDAKKD